MKPKTQGFSVWVTRRIPQAGLDLLGGVCATVDVEPEDRPVSRARLLEQVRGRDGVLCHLTDVIDDEVMEAAGRQCRVFANYAVGYNNIDVEAATRRGILVTNTPDVLTETTADLAWALLMAAARRIVESDRFLRSGRWEGWGPMQFPGQDVHGAVLGIVGAGRIGLAVARRAAGFRMRLLYTDPEPRPDMEALGARRVELPELLSESDFVSLHAPLTPATRHLIGRSELARMKPTACLVNTARGPLIDETALVEALREGRIAAAGLDVYEHEPRLTPGLTSLDNVVCTCHIGSATRATRTRMAVMAAENVVAALEGRLPPHAVNPQAWRPAG